MVMDEVLVRCTASFLSMLCLESRCVPVGLEVLGVLSISHASAL